MNNSVLTRPVVISGVVFGVLTALPPFAAINACTCCSLVALAGFLAVYFSGREDPSPWPIGRGALLGAASGALAAVVGSLFSIPLGMLARRFLRMDEGLLEQAIDQLGLRNPALLEALREMIVRGSEQAAPLFSLAWMVWFVLGLIVTFFLYCIFASLGGMLAASLIRRNTPPARGGTQPVVLPPLPPLPAASPEPPVVPDAEPEAQGDQERPSREG